MQEMTKTLSLNVKKNIMKTLRNMLSEEFREKLMKNLIQNPKEAVKEIEKDPQILKMLLDSEGEKIKYIKMNEELQTKLQEQARKMNVTQGWLIGAGLLLFLSLLDSKK